MNMVNWKAFQSWTDCFVSPLTPVASEHTFALSILPNVFNPYHKNSDLVHPISLLMKITVVTIRNWKARELQDVLWDLGYLQAWVEAAPSHRSDRQTHSKAPTIKRSFSSSPYKPALSWLFHLCVKPHRTILGTSSRGDKTLSHYQQLSFLSPACKGKKPSLEKIISNP